MIIGKMPRQRQKELQRRFEYRVIIVSLVGLIVCLTWALIKELAK